MNVFIHEFKSSFPSMLYWTGGLIIFLFFFMLMYPPISEQALLMEEILSNFPLQLRKALGISNLNISQLLGYYGFLFIYILLIASVYAMKSALSVLSEELRSQSVDFLLAKPVSRSLIVTAKLLSLLGLLLIQNLLFITAAYFTLLAYQDGPLDINSFWLINLSVIQIQLFFIALGLFMAVTLPKIKNVLSLALASVLAFFILQMLNESLDGTELAYITPFSYFNAANILEQGYQPFFLLLNLGIICLLVVLTYLLYGRKDMLS